MAYEDFTTYTEVDVGGIVTVAENKVSWNDMTDLEAWLLYKDMTADHFNGDFTHEFECQCGCGTGAMSKVIIGMLDGARELARIPFNINSAFRCVTHNANEGGREFSAHTYGLAVDIACSNNHFRFLIVKALIAVGFTRIIIYKTFIHADIDGHKPQERTLSLRYP